MTTSLYDLSVASYLQTVTATAGLLEKGLAHCTAKGIDPQTFVEARLAPDMLPLLFQILSVAHHSIGAIEDLRAGLSTPPTDMPQHDYAGLIALMADTKAKLKALTPADVNALAGKDMAFQIRDMKIPFTAEGFIQSFSLPNFYFHAATAYDILRTKGVPLAKRDFLGQMRMKM